MPRTAADQPGPHSKGLISNGTSGGVVSKINFIFLHGAAFETARNNAIGVARSRTDFYEKPPTLIRNEFGASAGGPVYLPGVYNGKERTFWFFAYEAERNISPRTQCWPMPTHPEVNPLLDYNWWGSVPSTTRNYTVTTRIDHRFTENDNFYARYSQGNYNRFGQFYSQPMLNNQAGTVRRLARPL